MNIKDLPKDSFKVIAPVAPVAGAAPVASGKLNIKDLPKESYKVVEPTPERSTASKVVGAIMDPLGTLARFGVDQAIKTAPIAVEAAKDLYKRGENVKAAAEQTGANIAAPSAYGPGVNASVNAFEDKPIEKGIGEKLVDVGSFAGKVTGQIAGGVGDLFGRMFEAATVNVSPERKAAIFEAVKNSAPVQQIKDAFASDKINPEVKAKIEAINKKAKENPEVAGAVHDFLDVILNVTGGGAAEGATKRAVEETVTGTKNLIENSLPKIEAALATAKTKAKDSVASVGKSEFVSNAKVKAIDDLEQTYEELMSGTTAGKKKLDKTSAKTEALNRAGTEGRTPQRTLAESGVIPNRTGSKLDTYEQAGQFRETVKPLKEANRQALKETGLSSASLKLDDLEARAVQTAKTPENINAGRFDRMEKDIKDEFNLLRNHYPTGEIPLEIVDDIKSARWDNVFKNKSLIEADVLKKNSEYAIAKSLQKSIEETAAKAGNKEVAQLNREIGDRLEAAKFLEDLNGKTIKGGRVLKYLTTLIGATAGETIPGKIVGALGGNIVGELILSAQVTSPIKRFLLRNLETADPKAYTETLNWLRKQRLDRETRLLLPAPSFTPMGGSLDPMKNLGTVGERSAAPLALPAASGMPTGSFRDPNAIPLRGATQIEAPAKTVNRYSYNPKDKKTYQRGTFGGQSKSPSSQQTTAAMSSAKRNPMRYKLP